MTTRATRTSGDLRRCTRCCHASQMATDLTLPSRGTPARSGMPRRPSRAMLADGSPDPVLALDEISHHFCGATEQRAVGRGIFALVTASTTAMDAWQPTSVKRVIRVLATSTRPIECELDDGVHALSRC